MGEDGFRVRREVTAAGPLLAFLVPCAAFVATLEPTAYWFDSGVYITAAIELGVAHPTGFPSYVLAGHLATLFPLGEPAWRVNLVSALSGGAASLALYACLRIVLRGGVVAPLAGAWTLVSGYQFWSQAVNAESFVFTLAWVFGCAWALLSLAANPRRPASRWLFAGGCLGIASGAHPCIVTFVPILALLAWRARASAAAAPWPAAAALALASAMTAAFYLTVPLLSARGPWMDWGSPRTLEAAVVHIFGTESGPDPYEPYRFSLPALARAGWDASAAWLGQSWHALPFVLLGAVAWWRGFRPALAVCGVLVFSDWLAVSLYKTGNREAWFLPMHAALAVIAAAGWQAALAFLARAAKPAPAFFSAGAWMLGLFVAVPGAIWGWRLDRSDHVFPRDFARHIEQSAERGALVFDKGDLMSALISYCGTNYFQQALGYGKGIQHVGLNVIYMNDWYRRHLKTKTDVVIPDSVEQAAGNPNPEVMVRAMRDLIEANLDRRPVYIVPEVERVADLRGLALASSGLLVRVTRKPVPPDPSKWNFRFTDRRLVARASPPKGHDGELDTHRLPSPFYRETNYDESWRGLAFYYGLAYLRLAEVEATAKRMPQAERALAIAARFADDHPDLEAQLSDYSLRRGDFDGGLRHAVRAYRATGGLPAARAKVAEAFRAAGRWNVAADEYGRIVKELEEAGAPQRFSDEAARGLYVLASRSVGDLVLPQGFPRDAYLYYRRALAVAPPDPQLLSNFGFAAVQAGDPKSGFAAFEAAVKAAPKEAAFRVNWGLALLDVGRIDEGRAQLNEAIRLDTAKDRAVAKRARDLLKKPLPKPPAGSAPAGPRR